MAGRDDAADKGAGGSAATPDAAVIEALANAGVEIEGVTHTTHKAVRHPVVRIIEAITAAFGVIAGLLLIAATVVVCQMIFVRSVLKWSTIWQTDFVVYSATGAIFLGAAYVLSQKGHVGVDFIVAGIGKADVTGLRQGWCCRKCERDCAQGGELPDHRVSSSLPKSVPRARPMGIVTALAEKSPP